VSLAEGLSSQRGAAISLGASFALSWLLMASYLRSEPLGRQGWIFLGTVGLALGGAGLFFGDARAMLAWAVAANVIALGLAVPARAAPRMQPETIWDSLLRHPARLLVTTFLFLCLAGALGLAMPFASARFEAVALIDAVFTAVSAVCVTGLIVLDTPHDFSGGGQLLILVLIQAGGLGIMTFSTAALALLGRRLSLRHEVAVADLMGPTVRGDLVQAVRGVLRFTFTAELAGALALAAMFLLAGDALPGAVWRAVFTSVSAFCNAGFALQSDSLIRYQHNPFVLHTVATLIILGGLSPLVVWALPHLVRRKAVRVQAKLVLATTAALLLLGFVMIAAIEWDNTLAALPLLDRLHNAWFQSVTLRTAGFNSIDFSRLHPASLSLMMAFMFIGGAPGGTAGGIKVTTAAVLLLAVSGTVRGRLEAEAFGRRIPQETVYRAAAIATIGMLCAMLFIVAVELTQNLSDDQAIFEVISALGTVGLSIGGTVHLDTVGKLLIAAAMFMGRVGPLTLFIFFSERRSLNSWKLPGESIDVG
jgi:trk system potassium uptake protein TrkH